MSPTDSAGLAVQFAGDSLLGCGPPAVRGVADKTRRGISARVLSLVNTLVHVCYH